MKSQGTEVAVYGTLRDVLRALEQDESDGSGHSSWHEVQVSRRSVVVSPAEGFSAADFVDSESGDQQALTWQERLVSKALRIGPGIRASAVAAPMAFMLSAAVLCLAPASTSEWAGLDGTRLADGGIQVSIAPPANAGDGLHPSVAIVSADGGELGSIEPATAEGTEPPTGFQAFAMIGERVLAAAVAPAQAAPPVYTMAMKESIETRPGEAVDLAFEIAGAASLPSDARLIVRGVPENASLSAAEPQQDGSWVIPIEKAGEVKLTAQALPKPQSHQLVAELRSGQGELLARATIWLTSPASVAAARKSRPQPRSATSEWATFAVAEPASETAAKEESAAKEKPEWMQWNRSALGGPR